MSSISISSSLIEIYLYPSVSASYHFTDDFSDVFTPPHDCDSHFQSLVFPDAP